MPRRILIKCHVVKTTFFGNNGMSHFKSCSDVNLRDQEVLRMVFAELHLSIQNVLFSSDPIFSALYNINRVKGGFVKKSRTLFVFPRRFITNLFFAIVKSNLALIIR